MKPLHFTTRSMSAMCLKQNSGFSLITAIFLLVILAALGAFILTISGTQQTSSALDVQGSSAYQAARAGIEWGSYQVLIGGAPCTTGYSYKRTVTINHAKVPNTDQTNFPVLFSGVYPYLATFSNGGRVTSASGFDIIFTSDSAGANKLDHEIESYDPTTGTVNFWVRVPTVSHTTDTVIYLCYGNAAITTSQENKTGVWDGYFQGVWHLKESGNGTPGEFKDSTSNANNGQGGAANSPSSTWTPARATGEIGYGQQFSGGSAGACSPPCDYIQVADSASLDVTGQITMEAWVKLPTVYNQKIVGKTDQLVTRGYLFAVQNNSGSLGLYPEIWDSGGTDHTFVSGTFSTSTWTHVAVTAATGGNMIGYINAAQVNSISFGGSNIGTGGTTPKMRIGASPWDSPGPVPAWPLNGVIDEVRISSTARSPDWLQTEYNNETSPSTFYTLGAETTPSAFASTCATSPYTSTQNITGMGGTLSGFTTTVTCSSGPTYTEGSTTRTVYQLTSTGAKGTVGTVDRVERQLQVTLIK